MGSCEILKETKVPNRNQEQLTRIKNDRPVVDYKPTTPILSHKSRSARAGTMPSTNSVSQFQQIEYSKLMNAKRKRSSQLGHEEEKRVMRILQNLQVVERTKTPARLRDELTELYIKPLPEYIQEKLKLHEERQMSRSAILFEELFEKSVASIDDNENGGPRTEKIQLPQQKPQITSRWQQKMISKLEKMDYGTTQNSNNYYATIQKPSPPTAPAPVLNRQLQVHGQGSSCASKHQPAATSRYKPPLHTPTSNPPLLPATKPAKEPAFPYSDPLPSPTTHLQTKDSSCLSPFEERILELEKMERDSILIERTSKPRVSNREATTRIPTTLMSPKYLESTVSFQSRVTQKKYGNSSTTMGRNGRSVTPVSVKFSEAAKKRSIREKETILQQKRKASNSTTSSKLALSTKS